MYVHGGLLSEEMARDPDQSKPDDVCEEGYWDCTDAEEPFSQYTGLCYEGVCGPDCRKGNEGP